ncbi:hypothetical protein BDL97_18G098300 [Sphagnum fallax]|nr:hypothetical protein BDL97_18G098300 [Sphagnum fallax]
MRAGAAELDRASLACPVGFIPSLRSTKHREADLLQLFFQLEDLHLVGPHLQSLNLSNCNELTRIHLKRPSLVSLNLSLLRQLGDIEEVQLWYCEESERNKGAGHLHNLLFQISWSWPPAFKTSEVEVVNNRKEFTFHKLLYLHLEVSGCSSLRRLNAYSRALKAMEACGCKNLVEVFLSSLAASHALHQLRSLANSVFIIFTHQQGGEGTILIQE